MALFAAAVFYSPTSPLAEGSLKGSAQYIRLGEALLHGVDSGEGSVSTRMPAASAGAALLFGHGPQRSKTLWEAAPILLIPLLVFALGLMMASPEYAMAALAIFLSTSLLDTDGYLWTYPQAYYSIYIMTTACALIWRARSPTVARSVVVGILLGAGMVFRSPLAFFAPFFVLCEGVVSRDRRRIPSLAALLCVPYLFLIPVMRTNAILHGQWFAFEWGPPDNNIVTGALGLVPTIAGDWRSFVADPPTFVRYGDAMRWALARIGEAPLRYLLSCGARISYILGFKPWLFASAAASVWLCRKRAEFLILGLLSAYFVLIHSLMSVRSEYFVPLWPVLAVLGAYAPIHAVRKAFGRRKKGFTKRLFFTEPDIRLCAIGFSGLVSLAVLSLSLAGLWAATAYGSRALERLPGSPEAFAEALRSAPGDAWLVMRRGRKAAGAGRLEEAVTDYVAALRWRPGNSDWELELAWVRALKGDLGALRGFSASALEDRVRLETARFILASADGHAAQARLHLERALRLWGEDRHVVHRVSTGLEKDLLERMRGEDATSFLEEAVRRWGDLLTVQQRWILFGGFPNLGPAAAGALLDQADQAQAAGNAATARRFIDRAARIAIGKGPMRRAAGLYLELKEPRKALGLSDRLIAGFPDDTDVWIDRAEIAGAAGELDLAESAFTRARSLGPTEGQWLRLARIYQNRKEYGRAIDILDPLTRAGGSIASALKERGICLYLQGAPDKAKEDLLRALAREPGLLSASLTLGAVYASQKRYGEELAVYERALQAQPIDDERSLRTVVLQNAERLRVMGVGVAP